MNRNMLARSPRGAARAVVMAALAAVALTGACASPEPPSAPPGAETSVAGLTIVTVTASKPVDQRTFDPDASIRMGTQGIAATMDPHVATGGTMNTAIRAVYDGLMQSAGGGKRDPGLAVSWRAVDPTTWEYRLRPNVRFHNGEVFTAEAVKFSIDRVANPDNRLGANSRTTTIQEVRVVDDLTVRIITKQPDPILNDKVRGILIIPPRYFQQVGAQEFARRPNGTGVVRATQFTPGQQMVGERFDDGWRVPRFKTFTISALPEVSARIASLRAGALDIIDRLPADRTNEVAAEGYQIHEQLGGSVTGVFFEMLVDHPVARRDVRLALNHATDKQTALQVFSDGRGIILGQLGSPEATGWNPDIKPYAFDPGRARELMARAGYPNGFTTKLHVANAAGRLGSVDMATYLQKEWERAVSVRLELDILDQARYSAMFFDGGYHPVRLGTLSFGEEVAQAFQYFVFEGQTSPALRRYRNDEFDRLYRLAEREMDEEKRNELLKQASRVLHEDAAMVFIGNDISGIAMTRAIEGFRLRPGFYYDWSELTKAR